MWKSLEQLLTSSPTRGAFLRRVAASLTVESAQTALVEAFPKLVGRVKVESVKNGVLGLVAKSNIDVQESSMRKLHFMRVFKERGLAIRDVQVKRDTTREL